MSLQHQVTSGDIFSFSSFLWETSLFYYKLFICDITPTCSCDWSVYMYEVSFVNTVTTDSLITSVYWLLVRWNTNSHLSFFSASCRSLSSRARSTRCFITNCPFRWNTGMSHLYLMNHSLFSGRLMSTCCRTNCRTDRETMRDRVSKPLTLCIISLNCVQTSPGCCHNNKRVPMTILTSNNPKLPWLQLS